MVMGSDLSTNELITSTPSLVSITRNHHFEVHDSPGYQAALKALGDGAERDLRIVEGL